MRAAVLVLAATLVGACQRAGAPPPSDRNEKPQAAVEVAVADRDLGGGDHEITLTATPSRDVSGLELVLDGRHVVVGAAAAHVAQTMTARVHAAGALDVVGTAWVGDAGHRRSKAASVHLGPLAVSAARPTTLVTMPDGTVVEEARP